jgi:GT2 family glycosyltransferase
LGVPQVAVSCAALEARVTETDRPATVTVVIPTHNRRPSLERSLRALTRQSHPLDALEVIVVADGCMDGTSEVAKAAWPFRLRVLEQSSLGPAAARNRGAAAATGSLLIFLDDDIEAFPRFVSSHVRAHMNSGQARVGIGYLSAQLQGRRDLFAIMLRAWWEAMFERMREPDHRFVYSDLLSGNFSIHPGLFASVGGFDETLRCHEDYELGLRLINAGARLEFVADAGGLHHEHTDLARALARKREEGIADVALVRKHPALYRALPLARPDEHLTRRGRTLKRLALEASHLAPPLERTCRLGLTELERLRLRGRWRRLLDDLLSHWYWRGVTEALGSTPLDTLHSPLPADDPLPFDIDLRDGLDAAMRKLDAATPESVCIRWGGLVVGTVPVQPGAEPLEGRHLRGLLRTRLAQRFADTLELAELLDFRPAPPTLAGTVASRARRHTT